MNTDACLDYPILVYQRIHLAFTNRSPVTLIAVPSAHRARLLKHTLGLKGNWIKGPMETVALAESFRPMSPYPPLPFLALWIL